MMLCGARRGHSLELPWHLLNTERVRITSGEEALADAYDAAVYFQNNAEEYGINKNDISVMGCSAGANLAASACLYANQQKNHLFQRQILMYPFLDSATDPDSKGKGSLEGPIKICI